MLIISRKRNEGIIINENICLTIADISGDKVRIGIEAPIDVKIVRRELLEIQQANAEAARVTVKPNLQKLAALKRKGKM